MLEGYCATREPESLVILRIIDAILQSDAFTILTSQSEAPVPLTKILESYLSCLTEDNVDWESQYMLIATRLTGQLIEQPVVLPTTNVGAQVAWYHTYSSCRISTLVYQGQAIYGLFATPEPGQVFSAVMSVKSSCTQDGEELPTPIRIKLDIPSSLEGESLSCAYWNPALNNVVRNYPVPGRWETQGCQLIGQRGLSVVCECNHLTAFAVVRNLVVSAVSTIASTNRIGLTITTYACGVISLVFIAVSPDSSHLLTTMDRCLALLSSGFLQFASCPK